MMCGGGPPAGFVDEAVWGCAAAGDAMTQGAMQQRFGRRGRGPRAPCFDAQDAGATKHPTTKRVHNMTLGESR